MWCLARYFPLMITEWIPPDNDHLILFCDLLRIVDLCCAPVTSATAAAYLRILIKDYSQEMLLLYPSKNISPKQHFLVHYPRQLVQQVPDNDLHHSTSQNCSLNKGVVINNLILSARSSGLEATRFFTAALNMTPSFFCKKGKETEMNELLSC